MKSYIKDIFLARILGVIILFVGFWIYGSLNNWLSPVINSEYLFHAIVIMSDGKSLSEYYKLYDIMPSFGGEYGLNSTISYMKNILTLYFIVIYATEAIWKERRDHLFGKIFVGIVLFRFIIIPNPMPLNFMTCIIIYTLLINGVSYAIKNDD